MIRHGASLVWTVIVCGVLMVVATTMSTAIVKESQMGVRMDDSAKAYAAAESGIDWAKRCLSDVGDGGCYKTNLVNAMWVGNTATTDGYDSRINDPDGFIVGTSSFAVNIVAQCDLDKIADQATCSSPFKITSTGSSGGVNRAIEFQTNQDNSGNGFAFNPLNPVDPVSGQYDNNIDDTKYLKIPDSFSVNFVYWAPAANALGSLTGTDDVLVINGPTGNYIGVKFLGNGFDIVASPGGTPSSGSPITLSDTTPLRTPLGVEVRLQYLKNVATKLEIYASTSGNRVCVGSKTIKFATGSVPNFGTGATDANNSRILISGATGSIYSLSSTVKAWQYTVGGRSGYVTDFTWRGITTINRPPAVPVITTTGGVITYLDASNNPVAAPVSGGYVVHTFLNNGTFTVPANQTLSGVSYLIVSGGGGGGSPHDDRTGGGGGGGGVLYNAAASNILGGAGGISWSIGVGQGGPAETNGGSSSISGLAIGTGGGGRGAGGTYASPLAAGNGGSGGGARHNNRGSYGTGVPGQGYNGGNDGYDSGNATTGSFLAAGGGGAGHIGYPATAASGGTNGYGGDGLACSITGGAATYYGGGGGGGAQRLGTTTTEAGHGGLGGGGWGGLGFEGGNGTANTGGGGGGAGGASTHIGGQGGSGIVVIRYRIP